MARLIPDLTESQLEELQSRAEAKVYRSLRDGLPDDYIVLFQVGWILCREGDQARDGETDFLVCHPDMGYICIEVKGGGIVHDAATGDWYSIDRNQQKFPIKNPVRQALRAKYSILTKLRENQRWRDLAIGNLLHGHAVFFPDIGDVRPVASADLPQALIGSAPDLSSPAPWVKGVFDLWRNDNSSFDAPGMRGVRLFEELFARSFTVTPLLSIRLAEQQQKRVTLTRDQLRVLDFLRSHRRVAVSGGAGTGKTVLAMEKARRLASEGFHTLLTCYSEQLAEYMAVQCQDLGCLTVKSFHQLCYQLVDAARTKSGRDLLSEAKKTYPNTDFYDVQLPNALSYSLDVLDESFNAIICDEGQDFRDEYWMPLELLLDECDKSAFYIFYDHNQNLYSCASTFPIQDAPFLLSTNCRNTAPIHRAAYRYYKGEPVDPPDLEGEDIQFVEVRGVQAQARKINIQIVELIARQKVSPGDITVLIADAELESQYSDALRQLPLPKPAVWLFDDIRGSNDVLVETIKRFKGLESPIIFLWGLDSLDLSRYQELMYVGMSRANSMLVIVGEEGVSGRIWPESTDA